MNNSDFNDHVVLLHGIGMSKLSMSFISSALKQAGFRTHNITYPSTDISIEENAAHIATIMTQKGLQAVQNLHLACHSMGGLVGLNIAASGEFPNLRRMVTLGTPYSGSPVADFFSGSLLNDLYRPLFGPAGQQLKTKHREETGIPPLPPSLEVGTIAGDRSWQHLPFNMLMNDHGDNDGVVSVTSATFKGAKDSIILAHTHDTMLLWDGPRQVVSFLRHGHFDVK